MPRNVRSIAAASNARSNVVARVVRTVERGIHALGRGTVRVLYRLDLVPRVPDEDAIYVVLLGGRLDAASTTEDDDSIETSLTDRVTPTAPTRTPDPHGAA